MRRASLGKTRSALKRWILSQSQGASEARSRKKTAMAGFTIFVDESGLFHQRALGHRVVVALILSLPFEQAEEEAKALDEAAEEAAE